MKTNCKYIGRIISPAAVFVAVVLAGCSKEETAPGEPQQRQTAEEANKTVVPVVLTRAEQRDFEERLDVQGNLEGKNFALVPALIDGRIEAIYVDEGDYVEKGKTKLFQVDKVKVEKAVEISRQDLAMARSGLRESKANLDRVQADFEKAKLDYERFERLLEQDAVTQDAFEKQESRFKQTQAMLDYAKTAVDLAGERERQAQAALEIAKKNLSDSLIYAPLTGRVTLRLKEPGEMAGAGKPVLRIEDPSVLEASAFLPAQHYPRVHVDKTPLRIEVYGVQLDEQVITYKSPAIHPQLRTFEIKSVITDPKEGVVSGAMAQMTAILDRRTALGVPSKCVQFRDGRKVVFVLQNSKAHMVEVSTGLENDGWTEVDGEGLEPGTKVVSMGQFLLDEGTPVDVQRESS